MKIKKETLYEFKKYFKPCNYEYYIEDKKYYDCHLGGNNNNISFDENSEKETIIVCDSEMYDKLCKYQLSIERDKKIEMILKNK